MRPITMVKNLFFLVVCLLMLQQATAGTRIGKVALRVAEYQQEQKSFQPINILDRSVVQVNENASATIRSYTLISINATALAGILNTQPEFIKVALPAVANRQPSNLLLYKVNISSNGFTLETSSGSRYNELNKIVHYRGMIEGDNYSVASFSFSKEETMGMISNDEGNYIVGKLEGSNANAYVLYNDVDLIPNFTYSCGTNTSQLVQEYKNNVQNNQNPTVLSTKCVDWYYEIDYDIYVGKGSNLSNVNSYIQGMFNQVSTLYNNDGVSITLQTLYVWTATDPYTGPATSDYLNQFGAYRTSFAGDVANLIGYNGGGGIAYVNGLCSSNNSTKMGYMGINSTYNTVPTYSWTVEVVTHEEGHLLGSRHTHDCVWNGNNTRIDNCGPQAGYSSGTCAAGPIPTSGTIMSYCHLLSGVGINFNNGFGPQPAALILNTVNNASCLAACTSCTLPAQPGAITGNTSYCGNTSLTYSVAAASGATSYIWALPSGWTGTSTTNSITVTTSGTSGAVSVTAVNSCGNSTASTLSVTGSSTPAQPSNITGNTTVCQGVSQIYTTPTVSGATSYIWTLPSGWSGTSTTNSITVIPGSSSGNISVAASNTCGTSSARVISVAIGSTPTQPLAISGLTSVCSSTSYTYSIAAVSGATSYNWSLPAGWSGSSTTTSITVVSGTSGGNISVSATNGCGTSAASTLAVTLGAAPSTPSAIIGQSTGACNISGVSYSVINVAGITYNWSFSQAGVTIVSGQGTNSITANFASGAGAGTLSVTANNGCSTSAARTLSINPIPSQPGAITGTTSPCVNQQGVPYSISPVAGAANYTWSVPTGARINDGTVTSSSTTLTTTATSVTVNFKTKAGNVRVRANNACGSSTYRSLAVAFACRLSDEQPTIELFPNPANDIVTIKFVSDEASPVTIQISDLSGKVVAAKNIESVEGENETNLNIAELKSGIYFVTINNNNSRSVHKLIKL